MRRCFFRALRLLSATILFAAIGGQAPAQILVTDWSGRLISYDPTSNTSATINTGLIQPSGMTQGPDGLVYVTNTAANSVDAYNPTSGAFVTNVISAATLGPNFQPTGLKFGPGPNPDLFVSKQVSSPTAAPGSGGVFRYNLTTHILAPVAGLSNMTQPEGLLFVNNDLYVAELNNYTGHIVKYDFTNPASEFIANNAPTGLNAATNLTIGPDGKMYVVDVLSNTIRRYDMSNPGNGSVFISSNLNSPSDLVFDNGHLYVSNIGTGGGPDGYLAMFDATTGAFQANVVTGLFYGSSVIAVPEPSSMLLLSAAGVLAFRRFRRK